ncbi:hypothetical protein [Tautonia marina]|jgi:hypothetical protein|uniref:hypothetical protein n=1 Tax=Tautonia marina TaxID=2653855 RepID=UPI00126098EB|nr:hypothetical protein [Tautonia marina]
MTKRRRLFLALVSIGAVVSLIVTFERVRIRRDVIQVLTVPTEPTLSVAFVHRYSRIDPHGDYRLEFDNDLHYWFFDLHPWPDPARSSPEVFRGRLSTNFDGNKLEIHGPHDFMFWTSGLGQKQP